MEEVLAKLPFANHCFQIAVRGRDNAHIHGNGLRPAYALEGLLLEHAQQFHLRVGRQVADFVKEESALVRLLEAADAPLVSTVNAPRSWPVRFPAGSPGWRRS